MGLTFENISTKLAAIGPEDERKLREFVEAVRELFSKEDQLLRQLRRDETLAQYLSALVAAPRTSVKQVERAETQPASKHADKALPNNARPIASSIAATKFVTDNKLDNSELSKLTEAYAELVSSRGHAEAAAELRSFSGSQATTIHEMELIDRLIGLEQSKLIKGAHSRTLQGDGGSMDGTSFNAWAIDVVVDKKDAPPLRDAGFSQRRTAEAGRAERRTKPEDYCPMQQPPAKDNNASFHAFQGEHLKSVTARLRADGNTNPFVEAMSELATQWATMTEEKKAPFVTAGRSANEEKDKQQKKREVTKRLWAAKQQALLLCVVVYFGLLPCFLASLLPPFSSRRPTN